MRADTIYTNALVAALGFASFLSVDVALAAAPVAPQVSADAATCQAGMTALKNNMYQYPARPETAPAGKESFKVVYERFKATQLPACDRVSTYLKVNSAQAVAASANAVMKTDGAAAFADYMTGRNGVVWIGDRILGYCPNLHRSQYDCVSGPERLLGSAIPSALKILEPLAALECEPETGWSGCRVVTASTGSVRILSTPAVSLAAQKAVEVVYTTMLASLKSPYDASKFDGYKVYITNGEAWPDLKSRAPMGFMGSDERNDELRGGTSPSYLWIEEQMMCKKGVATRNAAFAAGKRKDRDDDSRTFDQVVHEFAHAIDFKFNLGPLYSAAIFPGAKDYPSAEDYAWGVQHFFGTPTGSLNAAQSGFLDKLFDRSIANKTPFTCASLMP